MAEDIIIPIDITGGMDDHSSLKQTQDPELLENITLDDNGYPKKRNGFDLRSANINSIGVNGDFDSNTARCLISESKKDTTVFEKYTGIYNYTTQKTELDNARKSATDLGFNLGLGASYIEIDTSQRRLNTANKTDTFTQMEFNAQIKDGNIHAIFYDQDLDGQIIDRDSGQYLLDENTANRQGVRYPKMIQTSHNVYYCYIDAAANKLWVRSVDGNDNFEWDINTGYVFLSPTTSASLGFDFVFDRLDVCVDDNENIYISYLICSVVDFDLKVMIEPRVLKLDKQLNYITEGQGLQFQQFQTRLTSAILHAVIATDNTHVFVIVNGTHNGPWYRWDMDVDINGADYRGRYFVTYGQIAEIQIKYETYRDGSLIAGQSGDYFDDILINTETLWGITFSAIKRQNIPKALIDSYANPTDLRQVDYQPTSYISGTQFLGEPRVTTYIHANLFLVSKISLWRGRPVGLVGYADKVDQYALYLVEFDPYRGLIPVVHINNADKLASYTINWTESGQISDLIVEGNDLLAPVTFTSDLYDAEAEKNNWLSEAQHVRAVLIKISEKFISKTTFNELVIASSNIPVIQNFSKSVPVVFLHPPYINTAFGGVNDTQTRFYIVVYEFFDEKGNVYRSQLSNQFGYNGISDFATNNLVKVSISTYQFIDEKVHSVALYRTKGGSPDTFYFVARYRPDKLNEQYQATSVDSYVSFAILEDGVLDGGLGGELYTAQLSANAELENTGIDPVDFVINHNNRIYGISSKDTRKIIYSKQATEGRGLEFNDTLSIIVERDKEGQDAGLVALASTENYLLCFKRSSIFAISGDGPNNVGIGETHTLPILVSDTIGCIDPASVISVTMGAIFKSHKGFTVITKGLQIVDINAGTEAREDAKVLRSVIHRKRNVVMFLTEDGEILCLDMSDNENPIKWTIFTGFTDCVDMTYSNDQLRILKRNGDVLLENEVFSDNNLFITQKMTTGWLRVGDIAEYQRVKRLFVTGEYKSDHTLKVDVSYDFEDYVDKTYTLTPITGYETGTKPADGTINVGGNTGVYEWDIHLARQKCSAIKFTIYDEERNGIIGESFQLEGLALKIGKKVGLRKINEQKRG